MAADACPDLLAPLMRHSLDNALSMGPASALTGPIARGDAATVAAHLAVLDQPACRQAYIALGHATLALAASRLPTGSQDALRTALSTSLPADAASDAGNPPRQPDRLAAGQRVALYRTWQKDAI